MITLRDIVDMLDPADSRTAPDLARLYPDARPPQRRKSGQTPG